MKKQIAFLVFLIVIVIIIVAVSGGVFAYRYYFAQRSQKIEENKEDECAVLSDQIKQAINKANYCATKSDCMEVVRPNTPCFLESYPIVNKTANISDLATKLSQYAGKNCPAFVCDFPYLPEKQEDLVKMMDCLNGKCIIKKPAGGISVSIKNILLNFRAYAETKQKLIVVGKNGGWGGVECDDNGVKLGMITQSDTLIYDDTGCIYVENGLYPGMRSKYLNKAVKIEAIVVLDRKGNPVLSPQSAIYMEGLPAWQLKI